MLADQADVGLRHGARLDQRAAAEVDAEVQAERRQQ
jgi:hypothetical protein